LYVRRWLEAPLRLPDGTLQQRDRGTPQGSSVSPVLANLFLHYAFDTWMAREFPDVRFERSDDFAFGTDLVTFRAILRGDGTLVDRTGAIKLYVGAAT